MVLEEQKRIERDIWGALGAPWEPSKAQARKGTSPSPALGKV